MEKLDYVENVIQSNFLHRKKFLLDHQLNNYNVKYKKLDIGLLVGNMVLVIMLSENGLNKLVQSSW